MQGTNVHVTNVAPGPVVTGAGVNALRGDGTNFEAHCQSIVCSKVGGVVYFLTLHTHLCKLQVHTFVRYFFLIAASNTAARWLFICYIVSCMSFIAGI